MVDTEELRKSHRVKRKDIIPWNQFMDFIDE